MSSEANHHMEILRMKWAASNIHAGTDQPRLNTRFIKKQSIKPPKSRFLTVCLPFLQIHPKYCTYIISKKMSEHTTPSE